MSNVRVLTERDLRDVITLDRDVVDAMGRAFVALSRGGVAMPPVLGLNVARYNGEIDVKTAFLPEVPHIAVKISPGYFDNPRIGLPSLNGLMVVLHANTGIVAAILLDNGYLTTLRTAAAGAVAADALARRNARSVAVLGGGEQAWEQVQAVRLVRPIEEVRVWARRADAARAIAARFAGAAGMHASAFEDAREAVTKADIVLTTTPSREPILKAEWLAPGQHVTAVGADASYKNELEPEVVSRADRYVPDCLSQCRELGELRAAIAAGAVPGERPFFELGHVLARDAPGRRNDRDITVCDLTGTGAQDTMIADLALARAVAKGAGVEIDSEGHA
jgi:ornithine cyclodeaminase